MVQVIYGDVLLLIDFCMNFFVLYTTGIVLRRRTKILCIVGAALVGGIYSVAKVFVNGNDIMDCIISFAVGLLMCYISFGGHRFLKTILVFFGTSALVGGIMFAVYFFLGSYHADLFGNLRSYAYSHIPLWLFTLLAAISFLISWIFSYLGRESVEKREVTVSAAYQGRTASFTLLLDSGNLAKEPISGKYVIMLGGDKARQLLGDEVYEAVCKKESAFLLKRHFRLICVSGVDGTACTYYGFLPDSIHVTDADKSAEIDAYIAVCEANNMFAGCDGIAHPAAIV